MKCIVTALLFLIPILASAQGISEQNSTGVSNPSSGISCAGGIVGCGTTPSGPGTWGSVQSKQTIGSGTSCAITFASAVSNSDIVLGYFFYTTSTTNVVTGIADDKSNAYAVVDFNGNGGFSMASFWFNGRLTNGPTTITITASVSQGAFWCGADEFSLTSGTPALDGHTSTEGAAITSSGSITTTTNGDLVYSAVVSSGVVTQGAGFSLLGGSGTGFASEFLVKNVAGSTAGTWTGTSGATTINVLAVK